jgi:hypothetical protein
MRNLYLSRRIGRNMAGKLITLKKSGRAESGQAGLINQQLFDFLLAASEHLQPHQFSHILKRALSLGTKLRVFLHSHENRSKSASP